LAWNITDPAKKERRERQEMEAKMAEVFQYMQIFGAAQGFAPPSLWFPTVDPA
jgi:hypothetical protein